MTKLFIAGFAFILAGSASAEINCVVEKGEEVMEVRVIDTFVDRTAFVSRIHPHMSIPTEAISVISTEKNQSIAFMNDEADFHLFVNKMYSERRLPPIYKAELEYGNLFSIMDCTIE